jgi:hypothetical protein
MSAPSQPPDGCASWLPITGNIARPRVTRSSQQFFSSVNAMRLIRPISAHSVPCVEVRFGGPPVLCCRIKNVRMQAFAGNRPGIVSDEVSTCLNYFNFERKEDESATPLECLDTPALAGY